MTKSHNYCSLRSVDLRKTSAPQTWMILQDNFTASKTCASYVLKIRASQKRKTDFSSYAIDMHRARRLLPVKTIEIKFQDEWD